MTWTERISEMSVMTGNILKIETREDHEALWGSHIYRQSLEDEADHADFQFYLDRDDLIDEYRCAEDVLLYRRRAFK